MCRFPVLLFGLLLSSCVSWFSPDIIDPSGSLSPSDIREIKLLVVSRRDIARPIDWIQVLRAGAVRIFTGSYSYEGALSSDVRFYKRHGKWTIDESTVGLHEPITTS